MQNNKVIESIDLVNEFDFESFVIDNYQRKDLINYAFIGLGQGGGKICQVANKVGYYVSLFNTAFSDLGSAIENLSEINGIDNPLLNKSTLTRDDYLVNGPNYRVTPFGSLGGAKKDRYFGKEAVMKDLNLLQERLVNDKQIYDADFVWIVASLGGGTASGSVTNMVRMTSGFIRSEDKRFAFRPATEVMDELPGSPTVGVIALWPEESASPKVKLNAAEALQELEQLHDENLLGNILLVDNQMLLDMAVEEGLDDWQSYCNTRIVQHLVEASVLTNLNSETSVDRAELMEVITQPGYLNITKNKHSSLDIKRNEGQKGIDKEKCDKLAKSIVDKHHFTLPYSEEDALRTIFMSLTKVNHQLLNITAFGVLQSAVAKHQNTAIVQHSGMYTTKSMSKASQGISLNQLSTTQSNVKLTNDKSAIFYYLCVYKQLPADYIKYIQQAIEKRDENTLLRAKKESTLSSLDVNSIDQGNHKKVNKIKSFDDFTESLKTINNQKNNTKKNNLASLTDFMQSSTDGNLKSAKSIYDPEFIGKEN